MEKEAYLEITRRKTYLSRWNAMTEEIFPTAEIFSEALGVRI